MIKCEKSIVVVKGNLCEVKTDLSMIINSLRESFSANMSQDKADEHIRDAVDKGFMTGNEIDKEIETLSKKLPNELKELIEMLVSFTGGGSDEN